jgi:hypothetical protein
MNDQAKERRFTTMLLHPYQVEHDRQRRRELRRAARLEREVAAARPPRRIRHAVGRSMIRIGSRLASDPARLEARPL